MANKLVIRGKEIKLPVIQGGMGVGVSRSSLASAVINAGGIGTISAAQIGFDYDGHMDNPKKSYKINLKALEDHVNKVRETSSGFLAVNILNVTRDYQELAKKCAELKVDAVITGAGLPFDMPLNLVGTDTAMIPIVSSAKALRVICKKWMKKYDCMPDAVIVEGPEAGGHLGIKYSEIGMEVSSLQDRVKEVVEYVNDNNLNIPVIAAGGIYNGHDVKEIMDLGANGVQVGTRFIATEECDAAPEFKQKFIEATIDDIVYVKSPVGYPGRAIRNEFSERLLEGNIEVTKCVACVTPCKGKTPETVYCITDHLSKSVSGDVENGLIFSGTNGYRIERIETVQSVIDDLVSEIEV